MRNKILVMFLSVCALGLFSLAQAEETTGAGISKERIVAVATAAVKGKGFKLDEVQVIYDDGNALWNEQVGKMTELTNSPNFGIFHKGFMNNYRTVYFDFKEPLPDIWVFVDKDTGEVLEVYQAP